MSEPPTIPRLYSDVCQIYPYDYFQYQGRKLTLQTQENYEIISKCGSGKYSEAFVGIDIRTNQKVVIKIIKPVKYDKINREVKIMQILLGAPFTLQLLDMTSVEDTGYPALIVNYAGDPLHTLLQSISLHQFKLYIGQLLLSLHYMHIHGIIHRDCKPANCCVLDNKLCLLDFNLASFYQKQKLHYRVATRSWKAPELLLQYEYYGYEVDIWAVGVMIFSFLQQKQLFITQNNDQCLEKIVELLGSEGLFQLINLIQKPLDENKARRLSGYKKQNFKQFIKNYDQKTEQIISKTLCYNPYDRASAVELLQFEWFDEVREELVKSYINEYQQYPKKVVEGQIQLNKLTLPKYTYLEQTKYPIPVSPNQILGKQSSVSDEEWNANWEVFQKICNKLGSM